MTLSDQINNLPENLIDGNPGHLENHATIHAALKAHEGKISILSGTGSPLGSVVPRFVGDRYVDTDKTDGAEEWRATGTGNGSWVVSLGDTGWRDISGYLTNGWTGKVYALRTTNSLEISCEQLDGTNATSGAITSKMPDGFFPYPSPIYIRRIFMNSVSNPVRVAFHPGRYLLSSYHGSSSTAGMIGGFTTYTRAPWGPLPGTEVIS